MSKFAGDKAYSAFRVIQIAFVIVPIIAGLDKFFYFFADWSHYLSPTAMSILQGHDRGFMMLVGVIEIIAGLGVIFYPKVFAYIVSLWLLLIVINLLMLGHYYDIAVRDIGLLLSAFGLGKLAQKYT